MAERAASVWVAPGAEARLRQIVRHAWAASPGQRARLEAGGLANGELAGVEELARVPVLRKVELPAVQGVDPPFGGLLGVPLGSLARVFVSPGPVYDPQGPGADFWRFGTALAAAGFTAGDVVLNCFSYHLTPAGFMCDAAARALGCVVIPGGVGNQELQVRVLHDTRATGYIGLPSYLLALLEQAARGGVALQLRKALVSAEPLPPSLRARLGELGVSVFQAYGTADLGLIAYECERQEGLHLDEGLVVEVCDPQTGQPVPVGETGEVVATLLDRTYPLIRLGTGDLSAFVPEPCPCGRSAPRVRGWLGRAGEGVKVRGIFVYPRQLEEALTQVPGVAAWQAVVSRDAAHRDELLVRVEPAPGQAVDPEAVAAAVRAATRVGCAVRVEPPGALAGETQRLKDAREWR